MTKSKSKKRKLNHNHNHVPPNSQPSNQNNELTHEEIWDDSALVKSWNEAVAEYEFYHSIHARGEDVDEVLARYQATNNNTTTATITTNDNEDEGEKDEDEEGEEGEIPDDEELPPQVETEHAEVIVTAGSLVPDPGEVVNGDATATDVDARDQTLENIKMAYYWAGYYSGLYDGQQQQQQQQQAQQQRREPSTDPK